MVYSIDLDSDQKCCQLNYSPSTSNVFWNGGLLGITFRQGANGFPKVRRISRRGAAKGLNSIEIGDTLVAFNDEEITNGEYDAVLQQLKKPHFPVILTFSHDLQTRDTDEQTPETTSLFSSSSISQSSSKMNNNSLSYDMSQCRDALKEIDESIYLSGGIFFDQPPLRESEYQIKWTEGSIGVVLKNFQDFPIVDRRTIKSSNADLIQIHPGDYLIRINSSSTSDLGFKKSMQLLTTAAKPIVLRFLKGPHSLAQQRVFIPVVPETNLKEMQIPPGPKIEKDLKYSIIWDDDSLGIVLRQNSKQQIYVHRLKGKGCASNDIRQGDLLISIADISSAALGFDQTVNFLKSVQRPTELVFYRSKVHRLSNGLVTRSKSPALYVPAFTGTSKSSKIIQPLHIASVKDSLRVNQKAPTSPVNFNIFRPRQTIQIPAESNSEITKDTIFSLDDHSPSNVHFRRQTSDESISISDLDDNESTCSSTIGAETLAAVFGKSGNLVELTWSNGPLGMTLTCSPDGEAIISRLTGRGFTPGLSDLRCGDELLSINGRIITAIGFEAGMELLNTCLKPIDLCFRIDSSVNDSIRF